MKTIQKIISIICSCTFLLSALPKTTAAADDELPKGWLMWHSYSSYEAMDSRLFMKAPDGEITEISGNFKAPMNGAFGKSHDEFVFMAIDEVHDEWDVYFSKSCEITNLTEGSGFRNEDPKFSPDGNSIVFKRGHWDNERNDFVYDLALLDLQNNEIKMLTDSAAEEAMPCFSDDGNYIYYADYSSADASICRLSLDDNSTETIFKENNVTAYYPMVSGDYLYFTKWYSAENHIDNIVRYDGRSIDSMPFNSADHNCSDACPVGDTVMIYSSSQNGSYDLYFYDGNRSIPINGINTEYQELGASFFDEDPYIKGDVNADGFFNISDVVTIQKWILAERNATLQNWEAGDLCKDSKIDVFDFCLMKRLLLSSLQNILSV